MGKAGQDESSGETDRNWSRRGSLSKDSRVERSFHLGPWVSDDIPKRLWANPSVQLTSGVLVI